MNMALEEKLTEEEKTRRILHFVHERRKNLICDAYTHMICGKDYYARLGASYHLNELAEIDPTLYLRLLARCLREENYVEMSVGAGLRDLAEENSTLFYTLYDLAVSHSDSLVIDLFNQHKLKSKQRLFNSEERRKQEITDEDMGFLAQKLVRLPGRSLKEFNALVEKPEAEGISRENLEIFSKFCTEKINDTFQEQQLRIIYYLPLLAVIDFDKAVGLYLHSSGDIDHVVRKIAAERFQDLVLSWKVSSFPRGNNAVTEFLASYFDSKYPPSWNGKKTGRLEELYLTEYNNFKKLKQIMEFSEAEDFDELLECNSINSPYLFISILGKGKGGMVYKVYKKEFNYRAIKLIASNNINPKEAELMAKLKDQDLENIVQIHDAGEHFIEVGREKRYAIVMEYVDGQTLEEILKERKLTPHKVLDYSAQILNGIQSLRKHDITHRDLKLKNIKVNSQGEVKILDFGIATDEPHPEARNNQEFGAPKNMEADDLISFGLLVYKMATGKNLIDVPGKELMEHDVYANEIDRLKQSLYRDGEIIPEYSRRIHMILDKFGEHGEYERYSDQEVEERFALIRIINSALNTREVDGLKEEYPRPHCFKLMDAKELRQLMFKHRLFLGRGYKGKCQE